MVDGDVVVVFGGDVFVCFFFFFFILLTPFPSLFYPILISFSCQLHILEDAS